MKHLTPCQAIRQYCIDCSGGSQKAPRMCTAIDYTLWPYRMRHNPKRRGIGYPKDFAHSNPENKTQKPILLAVRDGKIETADGEYILVRLEDLNARG